jgi:histidinol-phosphate/aromatic aminotransferase/cobyric acid decarboxylase-like protein
VANKAPGSVVLIDEAYLHFCDEKSCTPLVAAGKDVIILRTWSKIYGMAGLRAGVAMAKPELLDKLRQYGQGFLPTTGMVGARVSLETKGLVAERKKIVKDTRESLFDWLRSKNYSFVPSVSNHFMLDAKRPGREAISAMASKKVVVGRVWPSWPTHFRVTIGTPEEMEKFKSALTFVMA